MQLINYHIQLIYNLKFNNFSDKRHLSESSNCIKQQKENLNALKIDVQK